MRKSAITFVILLSVFLKADPVPTTLNDFFLPGSQPNQSGNLESPDKCDNCHGGYDITVEPAFNWRGSMMSQAARDPLFYACLTIANQDAPQSGDLCIRCHTPTGWLEGRSTPTDASALTSKDREGVQCDNCHKFVKPTQLGVNPYPDDSIYTVDTYQADQDYLATIDSIPAWHADGMYIADSDNAKRGPFIDAVARHRMFYSPFHSGRNFCGTCHDVSNPVYVNQNGNYVPNTFDQMSPSFNPYSMFPIERTFSEWKMSEYNSSGVYAPQFGGNKDTVSTCQDCHLRDVTGYGCNKSGAPLRDDLPLHDMTGGNTFIPGLIEPLFPGESDPAALDSGVVRATRMLRMAAGMNISAEVRDTNYLINVHVVNETAHKLPSGYPEGRRIWINVRAYNLSGILIYESCHYDSLTGDLNHDEAAKIYEIKPGISNQVSPVVNYPVGPSFHFAVNDTIFKDNRIPPRGFTNANFEMIQSPPVAYTYSDGQYWDDTQYLLPGATARVVVSLKYQTTSKEYVEFLRDENTTNNWGDTLYNLWASHGKSYPVAMAEDSLFLEPLNQNTPPIALCRSVTIAADSNCQADVSIDDGSYDPDGDSINRTQTPAGPYPLGQTSVSLIVTDSNGSADTCQSVITVIDSMPPSVNCPANIQTGNDPGECGAVVDFEATATDNCSRVTVVASPSSGSLFPVGETTVEAIAIDSSGNADTCYFLVTVDDVEPPVISCPDSLVVSNDPGQCQAVVNYDVSATDNCAVASLITSPASGSAFAVGRTSVEVVAVDSTGNADTTSFDVIVNDNEDPVITCPADTSVQCLEFINPLYIGYAEAADNCDDSLDISYFDTQNGNIFTRTWTAVDDFENSTNCQQIIAVDDTTPPNIACPDNIAIDADSGLCGAVVSFDISATDNCDSVIIISSPESGTLFPVGSTLVTSVAIDGGGNADTCSFTVVVNDVEPPIVSCPANMQTDNDSGECGAMVDFEATATDNCSDPAITATPSSGSFFPVGETAVEVIASDSSGNADTCYFEINIRDNESPIIECPADTSLAALPDTNGAFVEFEFSAADNCAVENIISQPLSGSFFTVGTTQVICLAADSSGNQDTCIFYVTVTGQGGYEYLPGDANMANGAWPPAVIGSDVTYLVNYFRGSITNPACLINGFYASADVNASCSVIGSDVTRLVSYFRGQAVIEYCPDWEPTWHNASELPAEAPEGWPNCETPVTSGDVIKGESNGK